MKAWRVAFVVFLCFVTGAVLAAGAFAGDPTVSSDQVTHDDGSTCPDSDHGGPCGPVCPCTCCPGHAMAAVAFSLAAPSTLALAQPVHEVQVSPPEDLHPKDFLARIFRPPRA